MTKNGHTGHLFLKIDPARCSYHPTNREQGSKGTNLTQTNNSMTRYTHDAGAIKQNWVERQAGKKTRGRLRLQQYLSPLLSAKQTRETAPQGDPLAQTPLQPYQAVPDWPGWCGVGKSHSCSCGSPLSHQPAVLQSSQAARWTHPILPVLQVTPGSLAFLTFIKE